MERGWNPIYASAICSTCGKLTAINRLELCRDCNFVAVAKTLTLIPASYGLRYVRKHFGISGETTRASEYRKDKAAYEEGMPKPAPFATDLEGVELIAER